MSAFWSLDVLIANSDLYQQNTANGNRLNNEWGFLVLFARIVDKINNSIGQDPDATNIIGVLDIY